VPRPRRPVSRTVLRALGVGAVALLGALVLSLVLVPYDAARQVELTRADLDRMRERGAAWAWVAERSTGWLEYWRTVPRSIRACGPGWRPGWGTGPERAVRPARAAHRPRKTGGRRSRNARTPSRKSSLA
jgi:hypothetical protein